MNENRLSLNESQLNKRCRRQIADDPKRATICAQLPKVHVRILPNIDNPSKSLIFDIVDRELEYGSKLHVGRYSERHLVTDCLSFKSKVVSRCHCEVWVEEDGKLYVRDTKSSSGTFLNHVRLSSAGQESRPVEIHDGDILQLGVDFQGGQEEIYRSVKMKFELNRRNTRPLSFSLTAFQNLRSLTTNVKDNHNTHNTTDTETSPPQPQSTLEECCICLYALAPFQALFVAPCSHSYHFKCIRPLFESYPGFQCPLCRTYSDLEANVTTEEHEAKLESIVETHDDDIYDGPSTSINRYTTAVASSSDNIPMETQSIEQTNPITENIQQASMIEPSTERPTRERKSNYIIDKIKTVFFEKRKSNITTRRRKSPKRQRPMSFPHFLGEPSVLTRQPTT